MIEPAAATNRLAGEKSPYLLQHARNPVDWHPWGEAAFAEARATGRPIFLSIGYSTCHWCHVMAHESFEDPRVAAVMNELFVNIKVDREERPDVDRVYMTFIQATTGSGGWPMSVWLQPDLKPIFGGTYFPPADRYGQRGFVAVCRAIADVWQNDRAKINAQSEQVVAYLREHTAAEASPAGGLPEADALLAGAGRALAAAFDAQWGGFGQAPKFPRPALLHLLARVQARRPAEPAAREMMLTTLDKMAAGGMHDAIGGGFHRYAVDRYWHVPHFEKMLYDQAQLTLAYLEAFQITGAATYAATARDILGYVSRDLTAPEGGFYCAEDADSLLAHGRPEHAEGAFYVWTKAEIEQALGAAGEAELFCAHYGIEASGNTPPGSDPHGEFTGKNIPIERQPLEETARQFSLDPAEGANRLAESRRKLFAVRETRPRPHLDDKIVTSWNGLMISAFARAAQVLGDASYLTNARHAADFLKQHLYRAADGILLRSFREEPASIEGFADDYAFLIQGLLDLYEAGFNIGDLEWAQRLQEKQDELFHDPELGGYFAASGRDPSVLLRMKEDHDGAEPSASSISTLNLGRLAAMTGRADWQARAVQTASAFVSGRPAERLAHALPMMLVAVDFLSREPKRIAIAGRADAPDTQAMLRAVHERFVPGKVLLLIDGAEGRQALAARLPYLATAVMLEGRATAYLCQDQACQLPTVEPDQLAAML